MTIERRFGREIVRRRRAAGLWNRWEWWAWVMFGRAGDRP